MSKITFAIGAAALATLASLSAPAQAQYYGPHNAPRVVVVPAPPPPPHAYGYHGRTRWDDRRDYRHSHRQQCHKKSNPIASATQKRSLKSA